MVDGDVFRMSEAADAAESAVARVARKQTNKCRAAEELAKSAATLTLPSKMLPMLLLLMTRSAGCCCRGARPDRCCRSDVLSCWHLMMTQL